MRFSQKGFSLVGILVGVSLLGILTMGMTQVFSNMLKNQNYNKFRTQVENFGEELRSQLGASVLCTANFTGLVLDPHTDKNITAIKNADGNIIYQTGVDYGDHSFTIASMDFKSTATSPWYVEDNATTKTGRAILTVNYRATAEQAGPKDYFRTYTLQTHSDPTGKLTDCAAMAKMSDGIWRYNSTTLADIYYTGGSVGIGTIAPTAKLDVAGQSRNTNSSGTAQVNTTAAIDWNNGNAQTMSSACTSTAFTNMLDGGTYILAVTETGSTTCLFSQAGLTFYFSPTNGARTSAQRTVYTFQRIGTDVYVSWIKGFQ